MSVKRVMGLENEYGISQPNTVDVDPTYLSSLVVGSYANHVYPNLKIRWDYDLENPLRDARGFDASRADADPSLLTDEASVVNIILTNGARFYVDHAHPEYSSPEVLTPQEAVIWDKAGEKIIQKAAYLAGQSVGSEIFIHKNNTDNKGVSYGTHENYLVKRELPFTKIIAVLTPFFVTRQIFTGAGRLGVGVGELEDRFQISQRSDFFETLVGLETTMKRPIINTRDEPHADPNFFRRLHVIIGDANLSEVATLLKLGSTSLVLGMLEEGFINDFELEFVDPLLALREVSQDLTLNIKLPLKSGKQITALEVQEYFLEKAKSWVDKNGAADSETKEVLYWWEFVLNGLASDFEKLSNCIDWIAKLKIMKEIISRDGLKWNDPILQMLDLQYADLNPNRSIAQLLTRRGSLVRLTNDTAVEAAIENPPSSTRAWFRGQSLMNFPNDIAGASWDSVIFDVGADRPLVRIPTLDPLKGTQAQVEELFKKSRTAADLIRQLGAS
jgi:Pup amidohydrolase